MVCINSFFYLLEGRTVTINIVVREFGEICWLQLTSPAAASVDRVAIAAVLGTPQPSISQEK